MGGYRWLLPTPTEYPTKTQTKAQAKDPSKRTPQEPRKNPNLSGHKVYGKRKKLITFP